MTAVLPDIDPLTRLDAEFEIACESPQRRGEAGEFWLVCRACRIHRAVCSGHLEKAFVRGVLLSKRGVGVVCQSCATRFESFDVAVEVVPIEVH